LLNREFAIPFIIATIVAIPFGYFAFDGMLSALYEYRVSLSALPFYWPLA
jgi:hypothetical protein